MLQWEQKAFTLTGDLLWLAQEGLFKSTDHGDSWTGVNSLTSYSGLCDIEVFPNGLIFVGVQKISNTAGCVLRSTNGGQTFQEVYSDDAVVDPTGHLYRMVAVGNALVMQGVNGIRRSTDGGVTWGNGVSSQFLADGLSIAADGKLYVVGNSSSIRRSTDGGLTWAFVYEFYNDATSYYSGFFLTKNGTFIYNRGTMFRSVDAAISWQAASENVSELGHDYLKTNPATGTVYSVTDEVYKTEDLGQTWKNVFGPVSSNSNYLAPRIAFSGNGGLFIPKYEVLLHSPDDGETWDSIQLPQNLPNAMKQFAVAPSGKIFVQTMLDGFHSSTDLGLTWDAMPNIPPGNLGLLTAANDSFLFFQTVTSGAAVRSLDGGQTWGPMAAPSSAPFSVNHFYFWAKWGELFVNFNGDLYRSPDMGSTWAKINLPAPVGIYYNTDEQFWTTGSGQIYLHANAYTLFYSDDFGLSWVNLLENGVVGSPNDLNIPLSFALVEGQSLFAGTYQGAIWRTDNISPFYAKLSGNIKKDEDADCTISPNDLSLENWTVTATSPSGSTSYASTDSTGHYLLGHIVGDSAAVDLQIEAHAPNYLWAVCDPILTTTVSQQIDTANHLDFSATADIDCALLDVSINFWPARPCSTLTIVANYCNLGSILAADATLRIIVDPLITVNSTSLPIFSQSGDTLVFSLGNVGIGACGSVSIVGTLSCNAVLGQSICVNAHASPDSLCGSFPDWSGAYLFASAKCAGDSLVEFSVKNIGNAPSTSNLDYIVIEDQILLKTGSLPSMIPGQEMLLSEMPDGKTLRIEAEQEPGHPLSTFTAAWVEGCGTNPPSWGWILPYLGEDGDPFSATYCREVTTSYDPNAKEALPAGFGTEHFIRPGQSLDYFIQFQNTGNDTAFLVVLRDTLDAGLDPATIRMGASSHLMEWEIYGPGILKFVFKNILLPDSTTNEPASHGWVSFNIEQRPGLPLGTVIRNNVGIYFDANPPVLTNQTWHTLGENFLPLAVEPSPESAAVLTVSPNPMCESAIFELKNLEIEGVFSLKIMDSAGRTVRTETVNGPAFEVFRKGLPTGLWFFSLEKPDGGPVVAHGKLLAR